MVGKSQSLCLFVVLRMGGQQNDRNMIVARKIYSKRSLIVVKRIKDKTPMTARYTPEQVDNFMSKIPMHRFGEADDVAKVIEFLASDGSDYLTGQIFNVTGGWLMLS